MILFSSKGDKLKYDLEYYTQAFLQDNQQNKGFGLGLYIVNEILNKHKLNFDYKFQNGYNVFIISTS